MGLFQRIINKIIRPKQEPAAPKKPTLLSRIFKRKAPEAPAKPAAPEKPAEKLKPGMESAEAAAFQKAMWMIQNAMINPSDGIAEEGRAKAMEYLERQRRLQGLQHPSKQYFNRMRIAERFAAGELTTKEGQEATRRQRLNTFNTNMGIDMSQEQYDKFYDITQTDSYKKYIEKYKEKYKVIIQALANAYEDPDIDPRILERHLGELVRLDITPDIETLDILFKLDPTDLTDFYRYADVKLDTKEYREDDQARGEAFYSMIEKWRRGQIDF